MHLHKGTRTSWFFKECITSSVIAAIFSLLVSCGGQEPLSSSDTSANAPARSIKSPEFVRFLDKPASLARPLRSSGACADIGSEGGTVSTGPVTLVIPANALSVTTQICVEMVSETEFIAEFTPSGQTFSNDAQMFWDLTGSSAENQASSVTTRWFNETTSLWELVPTETPPDSNTTETLIDHFSKYSQDING